jgi:hypothetical protein
VVLGGIWGSGLGRWSCGTSCPAARVIFSDAAAAGVTLMAADPASSAAWLFLVVIGRSAAPLPPGGSRWWITSRFGVAADETSTGMWLVTDSSSADEVDQRAVAWGPADLPNKGGYPRVLPLQR